MPADRPLEGVTVVALEQAVAAPYCTSRLADAGARVIKIERAGGETARHYDRSVHGISAYFAWLNRGKESVVLDLKHAEDLDLLRSMLRGADVLVQNFAPGALDRMGLDPLQLARINPALISVSIVGYGSGTSYAARRAYDMLVQAESGLCSITGTKERPVKVGVSVADIATGMNAHAAVLEALISRAKTGSGRSIEIAMFDTVADWMNVPLLHFTCGGRDTLREGLAHAAIYPYGAFQCLDGEIIVVVQNPDEWRRFCEHVLSNPALVNDERYADNPARVANREILHEEISNIFRELAFADLVGRIERAGLPWARCSSVPDLSAHPALRTIQARAGGHLFDLAVPPLHPDRPESAVPSLGEHTAAVRAEFGLTPAR